MVILIQDVIAELEEMFKHCEKKTRLIEGSRT